jgi:hypothetical protein
MSSMSENAQGLLAAAGNSPARAGASCRRDALVGVLLAVEMGTGRRPRVSMARLTSTADMGAVLRPELEVCR